MDRLQSRTDPLQHAETYQYDLNENLTCFTDRRGTFSVYKYDGINRRTFAGFGAASCVATTYQSTVSYSYDGGNRLKTAIDSISGQISRSYDNLDNLQIETTTLSGASHTITYLSDAVGRRKSMTVDAQQPVLYSYDDANRITQISQGTANVGFAYDNAGRLAAQTLPNGVVSQYTYDANSRASAIGYQLGGTTLGT
jgi:YD repeat-containing protein